MANYSSYRIAGYIFTIALHISNMVYMAACVKLVKDDPQIKAFGKLQPRYFTCWNFGLQVIYAFIGLTCEILTLWNSRNKQYKLNKHLIALRDILFAGVLWPSTMLVFSLFWTLFLYDRDLIFPEFIDRVLKPISNHVIHTFIVPIVVWEVAFRPRSPPKSHTRNIIHLLLHMALYLAMLIYTYNEQGIWIYPILTKFYGTIYFPIIITVITIITLFFYYVQWTLTNYFWEKKNLKKIS